MSFQKQNRVAVVSGASSGIGQAAALALAAKGWQVIGLGRDLERCAAADAALRAAATPEAPAAMLRADLSSLKETDRVARELLEKTDRVDVLINNAGGVGKEMVMTPEGFESTFASNHLGPFLLTMRLLPLLRATAKTSEPGAVRIIATSSVGHHSSPPMDWNDIQRTANFNPGGAYTNAKLANVLFSRALAKRLAPDGIVAHAMEPGVVLASNFVTHADSSMQRYMATLNDVAVSPEEAAATLVWLPRRGKRG